MLRRVLAHLPIAARGDPATYRSRGRRRAQLEPRADVASYARAVLERQRLELRMRQNASQRYPNRVLLILEKSS